MSLGYSQARPKYLNRRLQLLVEALHVVGSCLEVTPLEPHAVNYVGQQTECALAQAVACGQARIWARAGGLVTASGREWGGSGGRTKEAAYLPSAGGWNTGYEKLRNTH